MKPKTYSQGSTSPVGPDEIADQSSGTVARPKPRSEAHDMDPSAPLTTLVRRQMAAQALREAAGDRRWFLV